MTPYSYNRQLEIFYILYNIDMITHGIVFDESVESGGTGWSKMVTHIQGVNCRSERNRTGVMNKSILPSQ